jgi:hypothetical protein
MWPSLASRRILGQLLLLTLEGLDLGRAEIQRLRGGLLIEFLLAALDVCFDLLLLTGLKAQALPDLRIASHCSISSSPLP